MAKVKVQYNDAAIICDELVEKLSPYCEDIRVAGSVRRKCETVGDIELVILPKYIGASQAQAEQLALLNSLPDVHVEVPRKNLTFTALKEMTELYNGEWFRLAQENKRDGQKYKKFEVKGFDFWLQVDVFFAVPENFGLIYLLRTGPADFSKYMLTGHKDRGALPPGYRSEGGLIHFQLQPDHEDQIVPIESEKAIFDITGFQYLAPVARQTWRKSLTLKANPRDNTFKDGWEAI
jgi:DNA polymerase/3'-5' exonuclease PolX